MGRLIGGGSEPVLAPTDGATGSAEDPEDHADHDKYAADRREDRDVHEESDNEKNSAENNHWWLTFRCLIGVRSPYDESTGSATGRELRDAVRVLLGLQPGSDNTPQWDDVAARRCRCWRRRRLASETTQRGSHAGYF